MPVVVEAKATAPQMGSVEYSMPLYDALDEIEGLGSTFMKSSRTEEGFGSDGVEEYAQLESIETNVKNLITRLRENGEANKEVKEQASDLMARLPALTAARRRGRRIQKMLLDEDGVDDNSSDEELEPVFDENEFAFSSDEKVKHPGKCMNYQTVRWIEKFHGRRIKSQTVLEETDMESLRRMFDHLDDDKGGTVDLEEIDQGIRLLNLFNPMVNIPREAIMEKMESVDADGSGEIDFDEFVSVMSSGWGGNNHFYRLSDEKEAGSETLTFFEFAVSFGREKALQQVYEVNDANWEAISAFDELFSIKMVSTHQAKDREHSDAKPKGPKRMSAYLRAKKQHRTRLQIETLRCNTAARKLAAERRKAQGVDLIQLGREHVSERAQQKCDADLLQVLAMHKDPKMVHGDSVSIARSFLGEADSHHPRSSVSATQSFERNHYGDIASSASIQSNISSMHRDAALAPPHHVQFQDSSEASESTDLGNHIYLKSIDEKEQIAQQTSENLPPVAHEIEALLSLGKDHDQSPVKMSVVRQRIARNVAQQCRQGYPSGAPRSSSPSPPISLPGQEAPQHASEQEDMDWSEESRDHDNQGLRPAPPQNSPRSWRRECRSPRTSPRTFKPPSSSPRPSGRQGPSVLPRRAVLVDVGSVVTDLTVQNEARGALPQPTPECGNDQTHGYVYRNSGIDSVGGGWRGASVDAVFPKSLDPERRQHKQAAPHHADGISLDSQSFASSPVHPQLLFENPRRKKKTFEKPRRPPTTESRRHAPKKRAAAPPTKGPELFQAFPARHFTPHKTSVDIDMYMSHESPVQIVGRRDGQPTEFRPLDLTVGGNHNNNIVHVGGDEYIDIAEQVVITITPSVASSVSGSQASTSGSAHSGASPSSRRQRQQRKKRSSFEEEALKRRGERGTGAL